MLDTTKTEGFNILHLFLFLFCPEHTLYWHVIKWNLHEDNSWSEWLTTKPPLKIQPLQHELFLQLLLKLGKLIREMKYLDCDQGKNNQNGQNNTSHTSLLILKAKD
jgi:hypothetical protein